MDLITIIGVAGALIILAAFFLNETHRISEDSLVYDGMNLVGSFLLIVYAIALNSLPFLVLNGVWFAIALRDVIIDLKNNKKS